MSLDTALLTATSGLRQASRQIGLVSQNIANASVEGYTRKTAPGQSTASGGVRMVEPRRDVDELLRSQARSARSASAAATLRADTLSPLGELEGDPADGQSLGGLVGALRDGVLSLRTTPNDNIAQSDAVTAAENLAGRLNEIAGAVLKARQSVQDGMRADVDTANQLIRSIARLDAQVRTEATSGRNGDSARDARDVAVGQLSDLLDVTPVEGNDGGLTLILRGGAVLPLSQEGNPLGMADAQVTPPSYHGAPDGTLPGLTLNGRPLADVPRGGRIGEALVLRDETLSTVGAELDTLATTLANRLGAQGLTLFTEPDGGAPPEAGSPAVNGFALRITVSAEVKASPAKMRDGTADNPDFPPNPTGSAGYTALIDRVLNYSFGDRKNATEAQDPIPTSGLGADGRLHSAFSAPLRLVDYAAAVAASQASTTGIAKGDAASAAGVAERLGTLVQTREGVDVDSEMAAMVILQNAYSANARVMTTVQDMWDALLSTVR